MSTLKLVREFKRKAKLAGCQVIEVSTSDGGHLHAIVDHGAVQQRITLPLIPGESGAQHQGCAGRDSPLQDRP